MSRGSVAAARAAADAATLEEDAFLGEVFTRLHEVIGEVGEARWPARGPRVVAAAVRVLAREQARLDAAYLRLLAEVEGREDVVPRVRGGSSRAAAFARASLGLDPRRAGRDADAARLTAGSDSDLAAVGGAYAAGETTRAHVDVAVGVHRRLRASVREQAMPVTDPETGELREERCIRVVDAALAAHARGYTVPEFTRIADRIVQDLDPPRPGDAHRRRYLHLSRLPDGSLLGRFACGPAQALTLTTVLAALAGPRPGEGDRRRRRRTRPARRTHPGRTPHGRPGRSHRPQPPDLPLPPHPHPHQAQCDRFRP
jgi:hypothetical protein